MHWFEQTISKILFMKIKYEREQRGAKVFTKNEFVEKEKWFEKEIRPSLKGTPKDLPYMQFLFYNTKEEFKADQLFEENEIIKIRQNSFEQILEKLETYNLSDTQDDVKGIAFEQFLGTTFRGELGQYFTPRTIHLLHPLHLVGGFELFRDTFLFGVFFYQPRKEGLCFFLYIGEVGM